VAFFDIYFGRLRPLSNWPLLQCVVAIWEDEEYALELTRAPNARISSDVIYIAVLILLV